MSAHCEHCHPHCSEQSGAANWHVNMPTLHVTTWIWHTGHCPICAERERIVAFMRREADNAVRYEWHESHAINRVADFIEDGENDRGKA